MFVIIEDGKVVTTGVDKNVFPMAVESPDDIIFGDTYVDGVFQRTAKRKTPEQQLPMLEERIKALEDALLTIL